MTIIRKVLALLLAIGLLHGGQPVLAQDSIDPEFLAAVQGRWITRFEDKDTQIEIVGREIRLVNPEPKTLGRPGSQYTPRPGDVVMIITSAKQVRTVTSRVDGRVWPVYEFYTRVLTDFSNGWRMTDESYRGSLNVSQVSCNDGPRTVYMYDHYSLSPFPSSPINSNFFRPDMKQRWLDNMADARVTRRGDWRECAKSGPHAPVERAAQGGQTRASSPAAAPASRIAQPSSTAAAAAAARPAAPQAQPESVPVTSAQELAEIATRERLNREQAAFAAKQVSDNAAAKAAFDQATADRAATIARQQADHQAAVAAFEAEKLRREQEHAARMAKWRADVAACKAGDKSRCAPR